MLIHAIQAQTLSTIHRPNAKLRVAGSIPCRHCGAKYPLVISVKGEDVPWLTSADTPHLQLLSDAISEDHKTGHMTKKFLSNGVSVNFA
jgi:hypothetical protein